MNGRCWVSSGVLFEFCDLSVNLKPLIYSFSHVSAWSVHIDNLSWFRLLAFLICYSGKFKDNFSYSRCMESCLTQFYLFWIYCWKSRWFWDSWSPTAFWHRGTGRVASLSRMMDGYLWKLYTAFLHARCQRKLFANDLNVSMWTNRFFNYYYYYSDLFSEPIHKTVLNDSVSSEQLVDFLNPEPWLTLAYWCFYLWHIFTVYSIQRVVC